MELTTNASMARRDPAVRAAMKRGQLARVAAKGKPGYAEMYAAQPAQIARAVADKAGRAAQRAAKDLAITQAIKSATEAETAFGNAKAAKAKGGAK